MIRQEVLRMMHDQTGHPGKAGTLQRTSRDYWWPQLAKFVYAYVEGCPSCQAAKVNTHPLNPGLRPLELASRPFQFISMDFVTDLPQTNNFDAVLTVVDQGLTKTVRFIPCTKTTTALELATLLFRHVFSWFGLPDKIVSDRGPQFASHLFQQLCEALGICSALSTTFHL